MSPLQCLLQVVVLQHVPKMLAILSTIVQLDVFSAFLLIVVLQADPCCWAL